MEINLGDFKNAQSTVFTGRPQGRMVREKLQLDLIDDNDDTIYLIIPKETTSINPSFFLGLLFTSFKKLKNKFSTKYQFVFLTDNDSTKKVLNDNINDGLRNATNSLNSNFNDLFKL